MQREQRTQRLAQLRRLAVEVGRLPPSEARAALLRAVRGRGVSVDTGPTNPSGWGGSQPGSVRGGASDRDDLADDLLRRR